MLHETKIANHQLYNRLYSIPTVTKFWLSIPNMVLQYWVLVIVLHSSWSHTQRIITTRNRYCQITCYAHTQGILYIYIITLIWVTYCVCDCSRKTCDKLFMHSRVLTAGIWRASWKYKFILLCTQRELFKEREIECTYIYLMLSDKQGIYNIISLGYNWWVISFTCKGLP